MVYRKTTPVMVRVDLEPTALGHTATTEITVKALLSPRGAYLILGPNGALREGNLKVGKHEG